MTDREKELEDVLEEIVDVLDTWDFGDLWEDEQEEVDDLRERARRILDQDYSKDEYLDGAG